MRDRNNKNGSTRLINIIEKYERERERDSKKSKRSKWRNKKLRKSIINN